MTFSFKIYTYINGNGQTVYRAKLKGFLGLYWWLSPYDVFDVYSETDIMEWNSLTADRARVITQLTIMAQRKYNSALAQNRMNNAKKLTLKFIDHEDIEIK